MGPCSPSSGSPSLKGTVGSHTGPGGQEGPEVHWFMAPEADPCPGEPASAPWEEQALHVGVLGAGLLAVALGPPALVAVDELGEEGGLLGVARDELVLQELLGGGPLPGTTRVTRRRQPSAAWGTPGARSKEAWAEPGLSIAALAGSLVREPQVAGAPRRLGGCTLSSPAEGPPSRPSWPGPGSQRSLPWHSGGASSPVTSELPLQTDSMPLHARMCAHTRTHTYTPAVLWGPVPGAPATLSHAGLLTTRELGQVLTNRGSLLRQASTNSLKGLLWWPSSVGGLFLGIRNRTRMGCRSELGGSPLASSMAVIPSDQISAWTESHGAAAAQAARAPRPPRPHGTRMPPPTRPTLKS